MKINLVDVPIISLKQIPDQSWILLTEGAEDPIDRILRENQIDMLEVLSNAESV